MFGLKRTAAITVAASVFSVALLGSVAFAAFAPAAGGTSTQLMDPSTSGQVAQGPKDGGLKAILDGLVAKGTITQAQEDAILAAVRQAHEQRKDGRASLRGVGGGLMPTAIDYIGLPREAVVAQLRAGKSLGEIADQQPGKSRDGLVAALVGEANAKIDAAVTAGKITAEQGAQLKTKVEAGVQRLVDAHHAKRGEKAGA